MANLFILGAGGFGTALAVMTHAAGHRVAMWSYKEEEAAALRAARENARLLPGVKIAGDIGIVTDFSRLAEADFVLVAVPSAAVRSVAAQPGGRCPPGRWWSASPRALSRAPSSGWTRFWPRSCRTARS